MRVLHVTRDFPPRSSGGISTAVGGLARAQRALGHEVAAVSFDGWRKGARTALPGADLPGDIALLRVQGPQDLDAAAAFAGAFCADVVAVHDGLLWAFATQLPAAPRIVYPHVVHTELNRVRGVTERTKSLVAQARSLAEADAIIAPSAWARARLIADHAGLADRTVVARLGVPRCVDDGHGERGGVFSAGRFDRVKGTDLVAALGVQLGTLRPGLRLRVAGGLPHNTRAAARWGARFDSRAELLGWCGPEALSAALSQALIFVAPSRVDTFGLSVLEAMAHGVVPVIASAGALPEILVDGQHGVVVAPDNIDALVAAVVALADDPARACAMGARARQHVAQHYLWQDAVREHMACYASVAGTC